MKVMCIDGIDEIQTGKTYEVKQCEIHDDGYWVRGITIQYEGFTFTSYKKSRFIPISDIDETEFERNYQKQTA